MCGRCSGGALAKFRFRMSTPPLPTAELARRVGVVDQDDPVSSFDEMGAAIKQTLVELQPQGWFDGRRILDFGCGSGKLLRHMLPEAERCEIHGCDIHEPSIEWLRRNLVPPLHVFVNGETPPLPFEDEQFDLIWAMSVFTHLTDHWADWLLEVHRLLTPDGRFVATFLGEGMSESIANEPWDPDRIGMNVLREWQPWDHGGPSVQHSEWWLREHWGRLFTVERVDDGPQFGHGLIVLDKRPVSLTREELIAAGDDPREVAALRHNIAQVAAEATALANDRNAVSEQLRITSDQLHSTSDQLRSASDQLHTVVHSHSWRLTAPLRAARRRSGT